MFFPVWRLITGHNFTPKDISEGCAWLYFFAWSISFYPQIILNHKRQSVVGLSLDFVALNISGFTCYLAYLIANKLNGDENVHNQDVLFGAHALLCCLITGAQCVVLDRGNQRVSTSVKVATGMLWLAVAVNCALLLRHSESTHLFTQQLGLIKVFISFVKYLPQVYLNYKRKSTVGWSVTNVLLDFTGGVLSTIKIFVDLGIQGSWDPDILPMLLLGLESLSFDVIFMLQHYIWYPAPRKVPRHRKRVSEESDVDRHSHEVNIPNSKTHSRKHASIAS